MLQKDESLMLFSSLVKGHWSPVTQILLKCLKKEYAAPEKEYLAFQLLWTGTFYSLVTNLQNSWGTFNLRAYLNKQMERHCSPELKRECRINSGCMLGVNTCTGCGLREVAGLSAVLHSPGAAASVVGSTCCSFCLPLILYCFVS